MRAESIHVSCPDKTVSRPEKHSQALGISHLESTAARLVGAKPT
jgi:hypothetical protein